MTVKGLSHACFVVSDLERSVHFYRDLLGLPVAFEFTDEDGEAYGYYLHVGARTFIELFRGEPEPTPGDASYKHICLEVEDIDEAERDLAEKGVEVTGKKLGNDRSWQAWIADPDGNRIELHQFTEESRQVAAMERLVG
ncbi:MAG: VOC family protein [Planctomycetota bacterium]